jgi:excisionase family DNA binding protein
MPSMVGMTTNAQAAGHDTPDRLTIAQAAARVGKSTDTVRRAVKAGRLVSHRTLERGLPVLRFDVADVDAAFATDMDGDQS